MPFATTEFFYLKIANLNAACTKTFTFSSIVVGGFFTFSSVLLGFVVAHFVSLDAQF